MSLDMCQTHMGHDGISRTLTSEDASMDALTQSMNTLCNGGLDASPLPKWAQAAAAYDRGELLRYRQKIKSTTPEDRIERLVARTVVAGTDERGRPTLRGVLPSRGACRRSRPPKRKSDLHKVIKTLEKVRISNNRQRRSRPRARIQGLAPGFSNLEGWCTTGCVQDTDSSDSDA